MRVVFCDGLLALPETAVTVNCCCDLLVDFAETGLLDAADCLETADCLEIGLDGILDFTPPATNVRGGKFCIVTCLVALLLLLRELLRELVCLDRRPLVSLEPAGRRRLTTMGVMAYEQCLLRLPFLGRKVIVPCELQNDLLCDSSFCEGGPPLKVGL